MKVSIIVCVYNHEQWIGRCLRSLQAQDFNENFEIIVVDDYSSDRSSQIIEKYCNHDHRIKLLKNVRNEGLPKSINIALDASLGQYYVRVDSDDFVAKNFLQFLVAFLDENGEFDAVSSDYYEIDEKEEKLRKVSAEEIPIACGVMFRSEVVQRLGKYSEEFKFREGHELMARFLEDHRILHVRIPYYYYRRHEGSRTIAHEEELNKYDDKLKQYDRF